MKIDKLFKYWESLVCSFVEDELSFLTMIQPYIIKLEEERKLFNKKHFNIFSLISELYRPDEKVYEKENPNSEVLRILLDPTTNTIGDKLVLIKFFEFIGLAEYEVFFPVTEDIQIEREKHRIDIYIHNGENAVIIESKLYGAPNQDFQLARYYLKAREDGYNVVKIVYLTLTQIEKLNLDKLYFPSEEKKYSIEDQKKFYAVVPEIEPLLVYKSAISNVESNSLSNFFENCSKLVENSILKLLLNEYSKLLIKLAGEQNMTNAEKKLISKIYESKESIKSALDFAAAWNDKDEALKEIFEERFRETKVDWYYEDDCFYKNLNDYCLFFWWNKKPQIGFWSEKFKKAERNDLSLFLQNLDKANLGVEGKIIDEEQWVYMNLVYDDEPIDEYFSSLLSLFDNMEKSVSKIKNSHK